VHLERAVALAPENFLPHFSLGALHAAANRTEPARRYLQAAIEREEIPQAYFLLGMVELDSGHAGAAAAALGNRTRREVRGRNLLPRLTI
jgi:hypothetical protein